MNKHIKMYFFFVFVLSFASFTYLVFAQSTGSVVGDQLRVGEGKMNDANVESMIMDRVSKSPPGGSPSAEPQEGGKVISDKDGFLYGCNKPQNANVCKKIPKTEIVDVTPAIKARDLQFTSSEGFLSSADPGDKFVKQKSQFGPSKVAGKWLTKVKPVLKKGPDGKPVYKIKDKPEKVRDDALAPKSNVTFVP